MLLEESRSLTWFGFFFSLSLVRLQQWACGLVDKRQCKKKKKKKEKKRIEFDQSNTCCSVLLLLLLFRPLERIKRVLAWTQEAHRLLLLLDARLVQLSALKLAGAHTQFVRSCWRPILHCACWAYAKQQQQQQLQVRSPADYRHVQSQTFARSLGSTSRARPLFGCFVWECKVLLLLLGSIKSDSVVEGIALELDNEFCFLPLSPLTLSARVGEAAAMEAAVEAHARKLSVRTHSHWRLVKGARAPLTC